MKYSNVLKWAVVGIVIFVIFLWAVFYFGNLAEENKTLKPQEKSTKSDPLAHLADMEEYTYLFVPGGDASLKTLKIVVSHSDEAAADLEDEVYREVWMKDGSTWVRAERRQLSRNAMLLNIAKEIQDMARDPDPDISVEKRGRCEQAGRFGWQYHILLDAVTMRTLASVCVDEKTGILLSAKLGLRGSELPPARYVELISLKDRS